MKYVNLLQYNSCKLATSFGLIFLPSSRSILLSVYYKDKQMYKYKILSFIYVIHNICYNIKHR